MIKSTLRRIYRTIPFKPALFTALRAVWSPGESVYRHLHFHGPFRTWVDGKPLALMHYGYQIENKIFWKGIRAGWEPISLGIWIECCKRSSVIIDVGANTGIYALVARAINPDAYVAAFEPIDRVFSKLQENVGLNRFSIHCDKAALSNVTGSATVYDTDEEHVYSVTVNKNLNLEGTAVHAVKIPTVRFDDYWKAHGSGRRVDLLKIDVETHEVEVLEGMGALLSAHRPAMLIEILNEEVAQGVERLLKPLGYVYFNIDEINPPVRVASLGKSAHYNFFVCQEPLARELGMI